MKILDYHSNIYYNKYITLAKHESSNLYMNISLDEDFG